MEDKIVVITGGNGLLGKAFLADLKNKGAQTINLDLKTANQIESGELDCDVTSTDSIDKTIAIILKKYGKIDGWVNNAYPRTSDWGTKFEEVTFESWQKNVDMQLNCVCYICQKICEMMRKQKHGSIVNIASIYGVVGNDFSVYDNTGMTSPAAYAAIKGGLINFTRYLASYYGSYNVRANCVSPGGIFNEQNPIFVSNYEKKVPLKRMGTPEDIAPSVSFLLSDQANYITGQNLIVDGGWTCI